ncbi:unnamed protein product, partial [Rotaria socialis]
YRGPGTRMCDQVFACGSHWSENMSIPESKAVMVMEVQEPEFVIIWGLVVGVALEHSVEQSIDRSNEQSTDRSNEQ